MKKLSLLTLGAPLLRERSKKVTLKELRSGPYQKLIDSMVKVMRANRGVGLALPQIGISKRICVVEYISNDRYPGRSDIPLMVLVNPRFSFMSKKLIYGWEGCLSLPGLRGRVPRSKEVVLKSWDRRGKNITIRSSTFLSVILQHEIDHLDGHVFLDRMKGLKSLSYQK